MTIETDEPEWDVGDQVMTVDEIDEYFYGIVVAVFRKLKLSQPWRYVVEDSNGMLMIYSAEQLTEVALDDDDPKIGSPRRPDQYENEPDEEENRERVARWNLWRCGSCTTTPGMAPAMETIARAH